jgi:hypothetical protein
MAAGSDRLNIILKPDARVALNELTQVCPGYSQTDFVGRALRLLAIVENARQRGADLIIEGQDGDRSKVIIL